MRLQRCTISLLSVLALSAVTAGQQVIVVDAQNRPGTQFTDLQLAIDFASPGDILRVRDGSYTGAVMTKGLQIHAESGAIIDQASSIVPPWHGLKIDGVPATQRVVVKGLTIRPRSPGSLPLSLIIQDSAGPILIESVESSGSMVGTVFANGACLTTNNVAQLVIVRSRIEDRGGAHFTDSTVVAHNSSFVGVDGSSVPFSGGVPNSAGVYLTGGTLSLSRCIIRGGNGLIPNRGAPGISVSQGAISLTGVQGNIVRAGLSPNFAPVSAIEGSGSLTIDPVVMLVPTGGAAAVASGIQSSTTDLPSLSVEGGSPGGQITGNLRGTSAQPFAVFAGLPASPLSTPFGPLWLMPSPMITVIGGIFGASGAAAWSVNIPNVPALTGAVLGWQGLVVTGSGLVLSNTGQHVIGL